MTASYDVLVTGSSGHLGAALMLSLPSLGFQPFGIDILPSTTTNRTGSVGSKDFVSSILRDNHIKHIIHAATLHKPHIESHTKQEFVDTNVSGTLTILEAAAEMACQIDSFLFISTTSTFGAALSPRPGLSAVWIDESTVPQPKNIYGVTKVAAEDLCFLMQQQTGLPVLVLKLSRFFPERDDDEDRRAAMDDENLKVLELAYRRVDIEDAVAACACAMRSAKRLRWGKYIISAPPPFSRDEETLSGLDKDPEVVLQRVCPAVQDVFRKRNWKCLRRMDRVYDSGKAIEELGWQPKYTFSAAMESIKEGRDWRSDLIRRVGKRGYHEVTTGVYTQRD
ncbi:NAD(P)-binding domain protein [Akanthomyces lecanii RCEF 1005]|uniref:NAD(P)-binding domain protein n=1 Tax=Akanthomyces lecanii RCEF 1005 TaxID=1081108 RepID=A0A167PQI1_CORDF|nr:NAD(P)-binding domain protein [Akanthomyces lecanii RCEF 1005]